MLKKPYQKIHQVEDTNYYLIDTADSTLLAIESVLRYKYLFLKREISTGFNLLHLTSPILMLLSDFLKLSIVGKSSIDGAEPEIIYDILDVSKTRKHLKELVDDVEVEFHRFSYRKPIHNQTVNDLVNEGYAHLTTEEVGTYMRKNWLARSDKNGVLRIIEVVLGGKPTSEKVVDVKFYSLNRGIVETIMKNMVKRLEKREKENEQK